ncbi:Smr/MutS family protein [Novosphingobium cyanobacteriorum]|uniref:Smr/MutS family protein n=1 Tax=Novosphingobium cyanobacteriorum TaxID=3024215 RepID=A0ABT6CFU4_9SPHN|nr:Smr/MutS family protein [Novosphingobium cyanobacteriorum]MDF8331965.1 Smr/MutS family protein [Novosphingobium cyanobacteriorum]
MRQVPRGLSAEEAALWRKVAETVTPLHPAKAVAPLPPAGGAGGGPVVELPPPPKPQKGRVPPPRPVAAQPPPPTRPITQHGLDASWDRKLARGGIEPDVTIDLHGMNLDQAHGRLVGGIGQALAMGYRVILLIAGKPRPHGDHDLRGEKRGAIRAKLLDWLAHSPHASRIAAVRPAQPKHGGSGAVYIVLRKAR